MNTEERFRKIIEANPAILEKVDNLLQGRNSAPVTDTRLYNFGEAARQLGISRQTVWRMVKEGRLATIEIRKGCRRVPAYALTELVTQQGGKA